MTTVLYNVVESLSRGKIVVANTDILPGQVITREAEPLLHFDRDFLQKYLDDGPFEFSLALACFYTYKKVLTKESQLKFASLFGPTTGFFAETIRSVAKLIPFSDLDNDEYRHLCPDEVEEYVKVANVMRLNMFSVPNLEGEIIGWSIFGELTRFAHSCDPNCFNDLALKGMTCTSRANRHIHKGEELTISYYHPRDREPTHIRRQRYLHVKEFTCHCPRCDAPGDDTRQFDCSDPTCKGVMMVCQPINTDPVPLDMQYTGVEYVEPHLLPCTVCHRAVPAVYQAKMFDLELKLAKTVEDLAQRYETLADSAATSGYEAVQQEIDDARFPLRHLLCLPILRTRMKLCILYFMRHRMPEQRARVQHTAGEYIACQERVFPHPNQETLRVLKDVCSFCIHAWIQLKQRPLIMQPPEATALLQKTLRMELLLGGRGESDRDGDIDSSLLQMMAELPPAASNVEVCAFCEESPLRAAITLSRCGACKKVMYCSAGCQKAHWKLHKNTCMAGPVVV